MKNKENVNKHLFFMLNESVQTFIIQWRGNRLQPSPLENKGITPTVHDGEEGKNIEYSAQVRLTNMK